MKRRSVHSKGSMQEILSFFISDCCEKTAFFVCCSIFWSILSTLLRIMSGIRAMHFLFFQ